MFWRQIMVAYTTIITYTCPMFERCLYFNVNALARAVNRIWEEAFREFDLSPSHAYLLRLLLSSPGMSPKQISRELKLEKSTITRFLDSLQQKGLLRVKRTRSRMQESKVFIQRARPWQFPVRWRNRGISCTKKC